MLFRTKLFLLLISVAAALQPAQAAGEKDTGYINVNRAPAAWPPPESLVHDLGSKNDDLRLKALRLVGLSEREAHVKVWSQSQPSKPVANAVVTPDRIELSYAAFGEDARQEAVVALEADQKQMIFAAVAVPTANGWERIGTFDYWCKYEMYHGGNALGESVELRPAPELGLEVPAHFELVLRASGGGTGIYMQDEGHFRVYQGELRLVITFVSRERTCDPTSAGCDVERRWFYPSAFGSLAGGTLVTARGRFPSDKAPEVLWALRDLEDRFLGTATCVAYTWNAQSFQYVPSPSADPCKPRAQQGSSRQPDWEGRN